MTTSVDNIYREVRAMAASFEFKPEERLNESALSKKLGTSRTPLREALNRLVAEGLLNFRGGQGFFCRSLNPEQVVNLYELREAIEANAIRRAVQRASDAEIEEVSAFLATTAVSYDNNSSARDIVKLDEEFHLRLARLSKNPELVHTLENVNERIRYVRWIAMQKKIEITHDAHLAILAAVIDRDADNAALLMRQHVQTSNEEATETVRTAFSQLYVPS